MCVFLSQNTRDSPSGCFEGCRLMKSMNVFEKEKKIMSLVFVKVKTKEWEESI